MKKGPANTTKPNNDDILGLDLLGTSTNNNTSNMPNNNANMTFDQLLGSTQNNTNSLNINLGGNDLI